MDASYSTDRTLDAFYTLQTVNRPDLRGQTMPLTPADVHNVAFSKPPIGKRGYNEDEVDAFLDLVETELAKLIEENTELRDQVSALEQQLGNAQSDLSEARAQASRAPQQ